MEEQIKNIITSGLDSVDTLSEKAVELANGAKNQINEFVEKNFGSNVEKTSQVKEFTNNLIKGLEDLQVKAKDLTAELQVQVDNFNKTGEASSAKKE